MDELSQKIVALINQVFARVGTELDAPQARAAMASLNADKAPIEIDSQDVKIDGPDGTPLGLRIYRPARQDGQSVPVMLFAHGGGWSLGDIADHDPLCKDLADGVPCVVVSVEYRLAPEHPFPAATEDMYAALLWLATHASEFGGDADRLVVAGDSSGGNLAAVVAIMSRDRGGPPIRHQTLVYPVVDPSCDSFSYQQNAEGYLLTSRHMRWFWDQYISLDDRKNPYAAPCQAEDLQGLPPAQIIVAELDPLRDEGLEYAERLRAAGVPVVSRCYPDTFHGFFSMGSVLPTGREAVTEAVKHIAAAVKTGTPA